MSLGRPLARLQLEPEHREQLEAMAKLKGTAGRQKMIVEHVHVHAGGQAIVGPVARGNSTPADEGDAK